MLFKSEVLAMDFVGIFLLLVYGIAVAGIEAKSKPPAKKSEDEELGLAFKKVVDYIKKTPDTQPEKKP